MSKVILDTEETDMGQALGAVFQVRTQNPDQQVGKEFGIRTMVNGKEFIVIRNLNSYTIREA
jgi:hypothetical protein